MDSLGGRKGPLALAAACIVVAHGTSRLLRGSYAEALGRQFVPEAAQG